MNEAYEISSDPARLDVGLVHHWLSTDAYWARGRSRETQDRAVAASLNYGAYEKTSGTQAGYARVITDRATFAWLCDVYIDPGARGKGLGTALVQAACRDLDHCSLPRTLLATADAHGLYRKHGFALLADPGRWMVRGTH